MVNTKITDLTDGNPALTGDEIPVNRAGTDGKITAGGIVALVSASGRMSNMLVYTATSNTWTKPSGLSFIIVECVGAGGGGGGGAGAVLSSPCGGGAGGYARRKIAAASLASSETVTVGTGGGAGGTGGTAGSAGSPTAFGSFLTACGGAGGPTGGLSVPAGGSGGLATSGDINIQGGDGMAGSVAALTGATPLPGNALGGQGGSSYFGGGGLGAAHGFSGAGFAGLPGRAYGSGGGAGTPSGLSGSIGGAGMQGVCIVWEYF